MIVKFVAGLCRRPLAHHVACNCSPNVRMINSGQHVYAGHVCWLETACDDSAADVWTGFNLFAYLPITQTVQSYSAAE